MGLFATGCVVWAVGGGGCGRLATQQFFPKSPKFTLIKTAWAAMMPDIPSESTKRGVIEAVGLMGGKSHSSSILVHFAD